MNKSPFKKICTLGLAIMLLAACGQRGPLTLPKPPDPLPKPAGYEPAPQQPNDQ